VQFGYTNNNDMYDRTTFCVRTYSYWVGGFYLLRNFSDDRPAWSPSCLGLEKKGDRLSQSLRPAAGRSLSCQGMGLWLSHFDAECCRR
jgi:hypothetical protein